MSLGSENGLSVADIAAVTDRNNNGNCGGWGGGFGMEALIAIVILFLFPMMFGGGMWGGGMFGGMGGWGNGGLMAMANGALTRADLCSEFNFNGLENAVRGVTQGLCDGFYAMQNSINSLGMNMMQGFHGVDNAICNLGYQTQQGFSATQVALMQGNNALQAQLAQCCCDNRAGQKDIQYQMATDTCAVTTAIANSTRDTIDNQNANARAILDALTAQRLEAKDERIAEQAAKIQALQLSASQAAQNAALMAAMDANKAEILRRSGHDCPSAAYIVQPPTPVSFPTNCCGQASFNGGWGSNGCGSCSPC